MGYYQNSENEGSGFDRQDQNLGRSRRDQDDPRDLRGQGGRGDITSSLDSFFERKRADCESEFRRIHHTLITIDNFIDSLKYLGFREELTRRDVEDYCESNQSLKKNKDIDYFSLLDAVSRSKKSRDQPKPDNNYRDSRRDIDGSRRGEIDQSREDNRFRNGDDRFRRDDNYDHDADRRPRNDDWDNDSRYKRNNERERNDNNNRRNNNDDNDYDRFDNSRRNDSYDDNRMNRSSRNDNNDRNYRRDSQDYKRGNNNNYNNSNGNNSNKKNSNNNNRQGNNNDNKSRGGRNNQYDQADFKRAIQELLDELVSKKLQISDIVSSGKLDRNREGVCNEGRFWDQIDTENIRMSQNSIETINQFLVDRNDMLDYKKLDENIMEFIEQTKKNKQVQSGSKGSVQQSKQQPQQLSKKPKKTKKMKKEDINNVINDFKADIQSFIKTKNVGIRYAFKRFDKDNDGLISLVEFEAALKDRRLLPFFEKYEEIDGIVESNHKPLK